MFFIVLFTDNTQYVVRKIKSEFDLLNVDNPQLTIVWFVLPFLVIFLMFDTHVRVL